MSAMDNKDFKEVVPIASQPRKIAPGVYYLEVGTGIMRSNVYFVRSGSLWVLIDTGSAKCDRAIQKAAEFLFGANTRPAAILLTHDHPDHSRSAPELAQRWDCLVYMHPDELPLVTMEPPTTSLPSRSMPTRSTPGSCCHCCACCRSERVSRCSQSRVSSKSYARLIQALASQVFQTESAFPHRVTQRATFFFRPGDRVLITGDAVSTVHLNSLWSFLLWGFGRNTQRLSGPPWYTTWSWRSARESVVSLARLEPRVLACGHGLPMSCSRAAPALHAFAEHFR